MSKPVFDNPLVEKIYQDGLIYIDKIRNMNKWEDGVLIVPFQCYLCDTQRQDLFMMTGDNLPMCRKCFESMNGDAIPVGWNPND